MRYLTSLLFILFLSGCTTTRYSMTTHTTIEHAPIIVMVPSKPKTVYIKSKPIITKGTRERCIPVALEDATVESTFINKGIYAKKRDLKGYVFDLEKKYKLLRLIVDNKEQGKVICNEL